MSKDINNNLPTGMDSMIKPQSLGPFYYNILTSTVSDTQWIQIKQVSFPVFL